MTADTTDDAADDQTDQADDQKAADDQQQQQPDGQQRSRRPNNSCRSCSSGSSRFSSRDSAGSTAPGCAGFPTPECRQPGGASDRLTISLRNQRIPGIALQLRRRGRHFCATGDFRIGQLEFPALVSAGVGGTGLTVGKTGF